MIKVLQAGTLTTVQDLGRNNFAHIGVSNAGAIDKLSLMLANILVNNPVGTSALEIAMSTFSILFEHEQIIAITGSKCDIYLDDAPALIGWRLYIKAGQKLTIKPNKLSGFCCYLAVAGGFIIDEIMGSCSTDMKCGFGGLGKQLSNNDYLQVHEIKEFSYLSIGIRLPEYKGYINVIASSEFDDFSAQAKQSFFAQQWLVTSSSNRMGVRLQGQSLQRIATKELLSHGVFAGVIQVPPNGQPILLSAESQTTGGYPKIAQIPLSELWKLGHLAVNKTVRFRLISIDKAIKDYAKQSNFLVSLQKNMLLWRN